MYLGDYKFCVKLDRKRKFLKFRNYLKTLKSRKYNNLIKTKPNYYIRWQDEFSFLNLVF